MATYVILSRVSPTAFSNPQDFKRMAEVVSEKIKSECPGVTWKQSYATMGRFDAVDIVEADDAKEVQKALLIVRGYGQASTETLRATPWKEFLDKL